MKQVTQSLKDGRISVVEVPPPVLQPHGAIVRTAWSLISAGTEMAKVELGRRSLVGKARSRPDQARQVLDKVRRDGLLSTYRTVMTRLEEASPLGYSAAGVVCEVGELAAGIRVGDRVACGGGGYANHAEVLYVPQNLCAPVPDDVDLADAAYATVGAIALQGVRLAGLGVGDKVAVIGLGLVGQLAAQLASASGCEVAGIDLVEEKCRLARELGARGVIAGAGDEVTGWSDEFTRGMGFDAVLVAAATKGSGPIALAGRIARDRGTVIVIGDVGLEVPRGPFYDKELVLRVSRSYGPGRYDRLYEEHGIDYPAGYVRWTEGHNIKEFLRLLSRGAVRVAPLTTHRFAIDDASAAYEMLAGPDGSWAVGVLLEYPPHEDDPRSIALPLRAMKPGRPTVAEEAHVGIALVGAGNFATATLLPALRADARVALRTVMTTSGLSARDVATRFGFAACAADIDVVLEDERTVGVLIATRHDAHAELAVRCLEAGKTVFVEKPLALTEVELARVVTAWQASPGDLMVGFNRRFSPLAGEVAEALAGRSGPVTVVARVNAGTVAQSHWTQRLEEGGGRIVGEVCHFVDLACFLTGSRPIEVVASAIGNGKSAALQDTLSAIVRFTDGSLATLVYVATGDTALAKERFEVFSGGRSFVIDDFRQLIRYEDGRVRRRRAGGQDKGHSAEMRAFVDLVSGRPSSVLDFESCVWSTAATFKIVESLAMGQPVRVTYPEAGGDGDVARG